MMSQAAGETVRRTFGDGGGRKEADGPDENLADGAGTLTLEQEAAMMMPVGGSRVQGSASGIFQVQVWRAHLPLARKILISLQRYGFGV